MSNILKFPSTSTTLKPEQALSDALNYALTDVLIVGYVDGGLFVRSSGLDRKEALWLLEKAKEYTLNPED